MENASKEIKFVYFGGEPLGVPVLEELKAEGFVPSLIVASPDRKSGRGQKLTPPPVKVWAEENNIPVWQPEKFDQSKMSEGPLSQEDWDVFIVVAYNHILPKWLIDLPKHDTLNVHPSLLPLLRGASPIRSAILRDMKDEIGVTVMQLDEKMDHGPIVAQDRLQISADEWPVQGQKLDEGLARQGGRLLAASLPGYLSSALTPREQEHEYATYCSRFNKDDGKLELDPHNLPTGSEAYQILLKIYGLMDAPGTFFIHEGKRIKIKDAKITDGALDIISVVPEGKGETDFKNYFGI